MKRVPVGVEDFKELIDRNYYYVDKSILIKDVMQEKVVLYTRPSIWEDIEYEYVELFL